MVGEEVVEEEEAKIEINVTREWVNVAPPPTVTGYHWAPHEVGLYAPFYITSASLEYLVSRVNILASTRDAESIKLTIYKMNERACHGREGKRKSSQEKFVYSSKKRILEGPLIAGSLDPSVRIVECLQYNLNSKEENPFKGMTVVEALDMAYELNVWPPRRIRTLSRRGMPWLPIRRSYGQNKFLGEEICNECLLGFDQGIAQCHYFFQVLLDHLSYDIMKMVVDGQLVTMSFPDDAEPPAPIVPQAKDEPQPIEVIEEIVDVEA
ncbi:hypothetical protein LR48_Vigan04g152900 [Vigna angularis]|uniref:Uncharacterized protein n=1 Tax=Phaseolus angularis TaxID=3914 RepID=A0A0L9UF31_PHAAN|nr:hypothetical protein LR48_Vigan04g152900 [Vigna angularis]